LKELYFLHAALYFHAFLMGASHRFLYVHISVVAISSHQHRFGSGFDP